MFTRIQALSFRSLRLVDQPLGRFRALVGPNGSGKTTFLDVIALLGDLTRNRGDVMETLRARSSNFEKLLWMGKGRSFQLAVEAEIPAAVKKALAADKQQFTRVRYQVELGLDPASNEVGIDQETLWLTETPAEVVAQRELFPALPKEAPGELPQSKAKKKVSLNKTPGGNDNYYTEAKPSYNPSFRLGRGKSALGNLPADSESFPASTWFRDLLERGVQTVMLNSQVVRQPSPPGLGRRFQTDGSNLPWVIAELRNDPARFGQWLDHVRTALEDIQDIDTVERPEDKHRYLTIEYANGARVSFMARVRWNSAFAGPEHSGLPFGFGRSFPDRRAGERHSPPCNRNGSSVIVVDVSEPGPASDTQSGRPQYVGATGRALFCKRCGRRNRHRFRRSASRTA